VESLDVTYENVQARERTQILMDLANKEGALLVGTGDLSELALGWSTYNGDHMSMYGVNCSVPKTLVRYLVSYVAQREVEKDISDILLDILETPVSPELLPMDVSGEIAQKTEDIVGPYELHDFFLYHFIKQGASKDKILFLAMQAFKDEYNEETILKWLDMFLKGSLHSSSSVLPFQTDLKWEQSVLSPRGDWRMPSDASFNLFLNEEYKNKWMVSGKLQIPSIIYYPTKIFASGYLMLFLAFILFWARARARVNGPSLPIYMVNAMRSSLPLKARCYTTGQTTVRKPRLLRTISHESETLCNHEYHGSRCKQIKLTAVMAKALFTRSLLSLFAEDFSIIPA
jgi:hypothetical protein